MKRLFASRSGERWEKPMKRLIVILGVLAFGAAFVPATSVAAGPFQSVTGSGWRGNVATPNTPRHHFVVSAQSGPGGVSGMFNSMSPNPLGNFTGNVTCLDVVGNQAIVGGVITGGGEPGEVGTGYAVGFIDNGSPPDQVTFEDVEIATPVDCASEEFLFTLTLFPVLQGNVVVG